MYCNVLCKYVSLWGQKTCWAWPQGQRWREKQREREGREKVGQTAAIQALNSLFSSPLLPLRGREGGHPLLQALNQPAGDLARPGYCARSLCLSACYAAILLPSLCSRCQATPPWAQRCSSTRCPFFWQLLCQNSMADSSVICHCIALRGVFDRDRDKTCPG